MSATIRPKLGNDGAKSESFRLDSIGHGNGQSHGNGDVVDRGRHDTPTRNRLRKKLALGALLLIAIGLVVVAVATLAGDMGGPSQPLIYHEVKRGDLPITVTERGNLESQDNVKVICEVDDIDGDGVHGTPILFIVPNGSSVKEGDLLVQLESSKHQERVDRQILDREAALAEQIKTKAKHTNQITQNETTLAAAELDIKLANLELKMYQDEEKGTHQLEVEEINRLVDDINNQILEAQASLELKKNDLHGIESLFKLGYKGKSELDRSRLEYLQAESEYAARLNKLKTQLATLEKKETYEKEMQMLILEGAVETAERNKKQVERDNEALLEQAKAAMEAADEALNKENERLTRYKEQFANCTILSPTDGMVAYAVGASRWNVEVRQGAPVAPRQHIISLPNLQKMQVETAVHESVLDEVKVGMPATIRVDAFADRSYRGSVQSVAVLPDQGGWMSSDTKVYKTFVTVDEEVSQLKPGMTAVVEIHIDRLKDVLSVPVQAVVQVGHQSWCYVDAGEGNSVDQRFVQLGRTNTKFVEIREGIDAGDRVVLNPMAIVEEAGKETPAESPTKEPAEPADTPEVVEADAEEKGAAM